MKKTLAIAFCLIICLLSAAGCAGRSDDENIVFTALVEGVGDSSILVTTEDDVGFDKASVRFEDGLEPDFELEAGQTVKLTIKPEIAESYPVQVRAVAIEFVSRPEAAQSAV
jgi:hypothetical protein